MHADISWPAKRLPFSQVRQRFLCTYRCHTIVQVHSVYPKTHRHLHTPTLRALNVVYFDFNFDFKHLKPYIYIYIYIYIYLYLFIYLSPGLTFKNFCVLPTKYSDYCPIHSINCLAFITDMECFYCVVRAESHTVQVNFVVTPYINNIQHFIFQLMHTTLKNVESLKHFKIRKLLQHVPVYKETIIRGHSQYLAKITHLVQCGYVELVQDLISLMAAYFDL